MQPDPKVNILLVDDHWENLLALEAILEGLGQNLVKATSGAEALRCLLHQDFAVILLDVQMPDMDGFETATLIHNRERSRHTPIIFLTAFSASDQLQWKGYSLGAVDYLIKPLDPQILLSKVKVFVELFQKTAQIQQQAAQLIAINAELRQSEERFRCLSASSPVGIFVTDIEGKFTYSNPRYQEICGLALEESLGKSWLHGVYSGDRERVSQNWSSYIHQGKEYSEEIRFQTPEGQVCWTHVRSSPMLSDDGKLIGYVGTVENISDRKQAEETNANLIREQEARLQAEAANRIKDEFLATLSHELRTPLNSMLGWAKLLRTRKFDEAKMARALETIERNAKLQAQLIEDILDVSRIVQGKLNLSFHPVNIVRIIDAAIDSVHLMAEEKKIEVNSVVDTALDLVLGDSARLQQVVWNLLTNAIKFTPEGGKVQIRLEQIETSDLPYIQIQVTDTGMGISQEFLPYIFERFRQADSTTTRSQGGLGLGLAIVSHLVELHGGKICAESLGEGQGATFIVRLPLAQNAVEKQPLSLDPDVELSNLRVLDRLQILVVDDNEDTLDFLHTVLEQYGAKVTAASSAKQALTVLRQTTPDILISDIAMPEEDGYALIRQVKALDSPAQRRIPAIALTAFASDEEKSRTMAAGFQKHMTKPVEPVELITAIAKLCRTPEAQLSHSHQALS